MGVDICMSYMTMRLRSAIRRRGMACEPVLEYFLYFFFQVCNWWSCLKIPARTGRDILKFGVEVGILGIIEVHVYTK